MATQEDPESPYPTDPPNLQLHMEKFPLEKKPLKLVE